MNQGKRLHPADVLKIRSLLSETELTIRVIAARFGVSATAIHHINKEFQIRVYSSHSHWTILGVEKDSVLVR